MKISFVKLCAFSLAALFMLSGCNSNSGPVPQNWYLLPENGQASNPGSLDDLGSVFDALLKANAQALDQVQSATSSLLVPQQKPEDWVPWHLAIFSSDFAITTDGMFGALSSEGTASVQANWVKVDEYVPDLAVKRPIQSPKLHMLKSNLMIRGTESARQVALKLEPSIEQALATGQVKDEATFRKNVLALGETFRAMAVGLSSLNLGGSTFQPSAFRVELSVDGEGNVTPVVGVGAALSLRFDWIIPDSEDGRFSPAPAQGTSALALRAATNLQNFVRSVTPDLNEAMKSASDLESSGYKLSSVRIGLILTADFDVAVSQGSAESIASIVFGDNEEEGGCYDPDGDGDCHNHEGLQIARPFTNAAAPAVAQDGGVPVFVGPKRPERIAFARKNGFSLRPAFALQAPGGSDENGDSQIYRVPHDKLQEGLKRAIEMSSFFTQHASKLSTSWKIRELETEFDLSLSGDLGFATIGGGGELELEFENRGIF